MVPIIVILAILLLVLFLLVLPLDIQIMAVAHGRIDVKFRFRYLYFICWESRAGKGKGGKQGKERPDSGAPSTLWRISRLVQIKGLWSRTWTLFKQLSKRVTVCGIESDLRVSLGDDYYTGMLAGLLIPVSLFLNSRFGADIKLEPCFEEDLILEGLLQGKFRLYPFRVVVPCLAYLCSSPVQKARKVLSG